MQQRGSYGETWLTSFKAVTQHLGERHLTMNFSSEIESIVGPYLAKNGNYRSNELLKSIYRAAATPKEGANLILAAARSASDQDSILGDLNSEPWLSPESRETILFRQIELARNRPQDGQSQQTATSYALQLIDLYLISQRRYDHH